MNKTRFLTLFLIFTIWVSTAGFTPLPTSVVKTTAYSQVPVMALAPADFGKTEPKNNTSVLASQVQLIWQASTTSGVTYQYCIFTKSNCPPGQWKSAGSSTTITVNLKPSSTYYWQVRAIASDGTITYADGGTSWKFTTGSAAPSAFKKSLPINNAASQPINPTLSWTASTGLNVNYQVCVDTIDNKPSPTCDTTWVQVGTATSYTLAGLDYGKDYYWQVRGYNSKGVVYADGSLSAFWHFTTRAAPPSPFVMLSPEDGTSGLPTSLSLAWSPSTGTNITYQYCLVATTVDPGQATTCTAAGGTWSTATASTFAPLTGLNLHTSYYWQVRALNNGNTDEPVLANGGDWWKFDTLVEEPAPFVKLLPSNLALDISTTPYLYWSAALGDSVTYQYCLKAGASSICDPLSATDWTNVIGSVTYVKISSALATDTTYVWQVRAQAAGVTDYTYADSPTSLRQFKTIPPAPVANPLAQSFNTLEDTQKTGQLTSTNPGNRTLIFTQYGREPASKQFLLSSSGEFTFTPLQDSNETVTFQYTIWDGVNLPSGPYTATITITGVNDKPAINPVADVTVFTGGDIFFTIETSDADLQYADTLVITLTGTLPAGAVFTPAYDITTHAASADFEWAGAVWNPAHPGPYTFTVRVTDSKGAFAEDTFTITITPYKVSLPIVMK